MVLVCQCNFHLSCPTVTENTETSGEVEAYTISAVSLWLVLLQGWILSCLAKCLAVKLVASSRRWLEKELREALHLVRAQYAC